MLSFEKTKRADLRFEVIVQVLEKIHKEFKFEGTILRMTTDRGSNFSKVFTVFGIKDGVEETVMNQIKRMVALILDQLV